MDTHKSHSRYFFPSQAVLVLFLLSSLMMTSCCLFPQNGADDTQAFTLGSAGAHNAKIAVRYSSDGLSWQSGLFPAEIIAGGGVGAASEPRGILQIIGWNDNGTIRLIQGLGAANWSNEPIAATPEEPALSAPALTFLGDGKWLVAFLSPDVDPTGGNRVVVRLLDTSTSPPRYVEGSEAPGAEFGNLQVVGHPAAVSLNGEVWLAWNTRSNRTYLLRGTFLNSQLTWEEGEVLEYPDIHCQPTSGSLAFTHDHESIYFAHLCHDPAPVGQYLLNILRRVGSGWQHVTMHYGLPVNSSIDIAGRSPDTLVAAWVGADLGEVDNAGAALFRENEWTELSADEVFGQLPRAPFALIRTGQPAR
jgi:hypothetical protein